MSYLYYLLTWIDEQDHWNIVNQCVANGYSDACRKFKVDYDKAQSSWVNRVTYSDALPKYIDEPYRLEKKIMTDLQAGFNHLMQSVAEMTEEDKTQLTAISLQDALEATSEVSRYQIYKKYPNANTEVVDALIENQKRFSLELLKTFAPDVDPIKSVQDLNSMTQPQSDLLLELNSIIVVANNAMMQTIDNLCK